MSISTTTSGASINYTTDGSTPSETAGTSYSGPITVSASTNIKAIAFASGMPDSSVASANYIINTGAASAQFVKTDSTTEGSWKGSYGGDGYNVIDDTSAYPSYVTVTPSGQSNYVWNSSTSDAWGLEKAYSDTDRIEATWYTGGSFTIDMNFTDGGTHQLAVYCLDESGGSRTETISVLDGTTNAVLDSRNVSNFATGEYLVWNLSGHVVINISNTGSPNAVISGLFFDVQGAVAPPWFDPPARVWSTAQSVSLTTMAGASIRYTTDGSTPSETAGTLYSGPITVNSTTTIKAMAYVTGLNDSAVESGTYTISALPSPWTDQDIGSVGVAGSGAFDGSTGTYFVQGSGGNVFNAPDQFNYLYETLSGDGAIIARVVSELNLYQATKAGVMIRETTDPSSAFAFVSLALDSGGVYFSSRASGAGPNYNGAYSASSPVWVKLVRQGSTFTGYYSSDGSSWTAAGSSFTVSMATNVLVGLAVVSTNNTALTTAAFDNVSTGSAVDVSLSYDGEPIGEPDTAVHGDGYRKQQYCGYLVLEPERWLDLNRRIIYSTIQHHVATDGNGDRDQRRRHNKISIGCCHPQSSRRRYPDVQSGRRNLLIDSDRDDQHCYQWSIDPLHHGWEHAERDSRDVLWRGHHHNLDDHSAIRRWEATAVSLGVLRPSWVADQCSPLTVPWSPSPD